MKPINGLTLRVALCVLSLSAPRAALAQGSAAVAEALFEEGRSEMAAGRYDSACAKFRESDKLDPGVGTKYNLADCEEHRGNYATAWELFKGVEGKVDPSDPRHAIAKQRRAAIAPKVPKLKIALAEGAPAETIVRIGSSELGAGSLGVALPLDPGEHALVVGAPQRAERRFVVTLTEGKTTEIVVSPGPPRPADRTRTNAGGAPDAAIDTQPSSGGSRTLGYVVGGVGIAGLVVGGVGGVLALKQKEIADENCLPEVKRCEQEGINANDSGRTLALVSTIGFAVGAVGVGLGAYLILTSDDEGKPQSALMTRVGPTASQVSWLRSF